MTSVPRRLRVLLLLPLLSAAGCGEDPAGTSPTDGSANPEAAAQGSASSSADSPTSVDAAAERRAPTPLTVPAAAGSGEPNLAVGPDGQAVLSWLQPDGDGYSLSYSRLVDGEWSEAQVIATGTDFVVNYADFPSVQPITADVWAAHWLKMAPDSYEAYNIAFAVSRDGGRTWSDGSLLNTDATLTEHGFVSLFPWQDGSGEQTIGAVWLDGRRIEEQFNAGALEPDAPPVGMSLRYARIGYDGAVRDSGELDELVCDCCQTDAAVAAAGPVIVYRDRTPAEIRDIAVRRYDGSAWQAPVTLGPDGWHIEGCPVNGPAISARGRTVAAAWFTAADDEPKVRLARSDDGGATFGEPVDVDTNGSFGYVDIALLEDGAAIVSWWRRGGSGGTELAARRIEPEGKLGNLRIITQSDDSRPLDVPQMVESEGRLIFAWTDSAEGRVESAALPVW